MKLNLNSTNIEYLIKKNQVNEFEKEDYNKTINETAEQENIILSTDSKIILSLVIFKNLKIYQKDITKIKLKDFGEKLDLKLINKNDKFNINFRNLIDDLKIKIKKLDLKVEIGTENAMTTAFAVAGISTLLSIILREKIKDMEKQKFIVIPRYIDENFMKIDVSGIFHIDLLHYIKGKTSAPKRVSAEARGC